MLHSVVSTDPERAGEVLRLVQAAVSEPVTKDETTIAPSDLEGWAEAVRALDVAAVAKSAATCVANLSWTIAGPPQTSRPADAVVVDPTSLWPEQLP